MDSFSRRNGLIRPDAEITIRNDAPQEVRDAVVQIAYQCEQKPSDLRSLLCGLLYRSPDNKNWTEFPNVDSEVRSLISECEWFEVYDFVEKVFEECGYLSDNYAEEINRCFRVKGVGWQLIDGRVEMRGSEVFELAVRQGLQELHTLGRNTAATELHEALIDLSRRPEAESTGAIQHAMAALECLTRDVIGNQDTLGQLVRQNRELFPSPVDQIVEKAWGYTSNFGRHLVEGRPPHFEEAELVVGLSGVLCRYLTRKLTLEN